MTTPDDKLPKALWLDKTRFEHRMKTDPDADKLRAALPEKIKDSLDRSERFEPVTPYLVYAITERLDMEKEAGRKWPFYAGWHEAHQCVKAAKEFVNTYKYMQTVDEHVAQFAEQKTINAEQKTFNAEQKTFNAEQKTFNAEQNNTNAFVKKELDARKQDKNDLKIRMRNIEGDVREQKGKEAIVERVLTFNKETKEEELQRSLSPCGNQIHGAGVLNYRVDSPPSTGA